MRRALPAQRPGLALLPRLALTSARRSPRLAPRLRARSVMLASKFFDDLYYNNAYYARVGGISNLEINNLEMELLRMISFSLYVSPEQYERYRTSLYDQIRWKPAVAAAVALPGVVAAAPVVAAPVGAAVPPVGAIAAKAEHGAAAKDAVHDAILDHTAASHYHMSSSFRAMHQTAIVS